MAMLGNSPKPPTILEGRFTSVYAYKGSNLVCVVDHASLLLAPATIVPEKTKKK